jgi:UDP-N-acetylglucosamine/UDP-N-acetylgalactosamine diphosphorylase
MNAKNSDGSLKLWAGNIATHLFDRRFLERENEGGFKLPYHIAEKSIPYLNNSGELISPEDKNGIKFETFVFDALADARNTVCIEVDRSKEFSPLKNNAGENSPETVRRDLIRIYYDWLESAGYKLPANLREGKSGAIEVSPLVSLRGENLDTQNLKINPHDQEIYIG